MKSLADMAGELPAADTVRLILCASVLSHVPDHILHDDRIGKEALPFLLAALLWPDSDRRVAYGLVTRHWNHFSTTDPHWYEPIRDALRASAVEREKAADHFDPACVTVLDCLQSRHA